ncbi:S-adenosylmethionine-dependent methyltransferase [Quillaja saponaria]|uniref:S-adenosylmethionine-dependent methyltransferase n=1 Tax=Quillaja saponaria TaxID=32244 RepID=A0AAD7PGS7_QUISA|nr:S-adenosylmethionine-dependent methyltransferase [Quillaja saponaria]
MSETIAAVDSHPMNGGDGTYSYTKNSYYQKAATKAAKTRVDDVIAEKLDTKVILSSTSGNTLRIADLGCSIGPNTFMAMQNIIDAVKRKYLQSEGLASRMPEFQVLFNDHSSNDFNTLFTSLPPDRQYFAAGVPGSFYDRLFPESSLHFVHSSYALQWLSKVPEELLDKNSRAWNKGRVHYTSAPDEVTEAYATQFSKDMTTFLDARSKELVVGGLMVLIMPCLPEGIPHSRIPAGVLFDYLGSSLMDMVKDGLISEDQVDSFNLPVYTASAKEMTKLVDKNGCFSIERMDSTNPSSKIGGPVNSQACTMHLRAGMEGIISKHFGSDIIDELFNRFQKKADEFSYLLESSIKEGSQLFVVLKRK